MGTSNIPFEDIEFHPEIRNPREQLKSIDELVASIKAVGLQFPLTVLHREDKNAENGEKRDRYYLIAGFRRHEAIRTIRGEDSNAFQTVEVKKFRGSIVEAQVLNLTENVQREELTPIEIANGVEILINLGYKQKDIAQKIGKSQTWVSNAMQFRRNATPQLKEAVKSGDISYGFARQIATLDDGEQREKVEKILSEPKGDEKSNGENKPSKKIEADVRKGVRETSGRPIRPTTGEIRDEVNKLTQVCDDGDADEFNLGVWTALKWILGERKTLRRPVQNAGDS